MKKDSVFNCSKLCTRITMSKLRHYQDVILNAMCCGENISEAQYGMFQCLNFYKIRYEWIQCNYDPRYRHYFVFDNENQSKWWFTFTRNSKIHACELSDTLPCSCIKIIKLIPKHYHQD